MPISANAHKPVALLVGLLLGFALIFFAQQPANAAQCSAGGHRDGTCKVDAHLGDGQVTLDGSETHPGKPGKPGKPGGSDKGGDGRGGGKGHGGASDPRGGSGSAGGGAFPGRDGYTVTYPGQPDPAVPPVTLRDLIGFAPVPGTDHMEPNGWMVVGLDTNFYARTGVQVQNGQLLGRAAAVRFTPIRYRWTYGDGASAARTVPGATWAAQGIPEFDPTPTSHVYRAKGTYVIDLTIDFRAEYRYGSGGWTPIAGELPVPANRLEAAAGDAKTVLVDKDCAANPRGPGC